MPGERMRDERMQCERMRGERMRGRRGGQFYGIRGMTARHTSALTFHPCSTRLTDRHPEREKPA